MAYTAAYVFAPLPGEKEHTLAGTATLKRTHGEFQYAPEWLSHPRSYPLDPVNLPLSERQYQVVNRNRVFGVLADAGPDDWGTRVLLMNQNSRPANELERLLRLSGSGVGELRFSLSRMRPKTPPALHDENTLSRLAEASVQLAARHSLTDEQWRLLAPGSSMGGARPKTTVSSPDGARLVKFSRSGDLVDVPLLEYATMSLLARAGIDVPDCRLVPLGDYGHAYSIHRFDREVGRPVHFISAHSLFNTDRVREYADGLQDPCSYMALAQIVRRFSACAEKDCRQLYRRMLANVLIGNTDDHARNHALIYDISKGQWRLSPAYDMLPTVSGIVDQQALSIGRKGREAGIGNALSCPEAFGLSNEQARETLADLLSVLKNWREHFSQVGMKPLDRDLVNQVIEPKLAEAERLL